MDVSFQVKEVADTIGAFTSGQLKELGDYLKNHYCLYLGTVPQDVDIVHRAAMRGGCSEGQLVVNDLTTQRPKDHNSHPAADREYVPVPGLTGHRDGLGGLTPGFRDQVEMTTYRPHGPARSVILQSYVQAKKISVIKVLRELTGMGLAEAKKASESVPYLVAKSVPPHLAEEAKNRLVEAGAVVTVH